VSCGAVAGGASLDGVDISTQSVIHGVVERSGTPVSGAYVRLLDRGGEFTAEVPTSDSGEFQFFAAPGVWTLRTLAPRTAPFDALVTAELGQVAEVSISL
jgi:uncharacterized protein DUF1416